MGTHLSLLPPCGPGVAVLVSVVRLGALLTPCPGPALDTCNMGGGGGLEGRQGTFIQGPAGAR